jgi:uncharacterized protein YjbI with pentapeptide repeats
MQRRIWAIIGVLLIANTALAVRLWTATSVSLEASDRQPQAASATSSLDIYLLLNQPGPLWLAGINLSKAGLQYAELPAANLADADLSQADLRKANLQEADLRNASLKGANLQEAYLERAYLENADLEDANLAGAYLEGSYLGGANLVGTYMGATNLAGADLTGALYNDTTEWPTGFEPEKAGALLSSRSASTDR